MFNINFFAKEETASFWKMGLPEVIDIMAAIISLVAVIIAVCQAKKQLSTSIKMHNQQINLELFDRRMRLLQEISNNHNVNETELVLLFQDDTIIQLYKEMLKEQKDLSSAKFAKKKFDRLCSEKNPSIKEQIEEYEAALERIDLYNPSEYAGKEKEFIEFCNQNAYVTCYDPMGEEVEELNYYKIQQRIFHAENMIVEHREKLKEQIKELIKGQITPVESKDKQL